ncbi:MAG TPA: gluconokinase, GntK/IdnK-type [Opitutaceae bacterium]|nr:gluconokinase, GntK/IdnK-type [Opitutaceae bacterium]
MPQITGLRSPHARVGRIVCLGRTLDKIRLDSRGALPPEYKANLGEARPALFDGRCCRFLGVPYGDLRARTLSGGCDEEILSWAHERGTARGDEECAIWNRYMTKLGWRDDRSDLVRERVAEYGLSPGAAQTMFELIDLDEGRPAGATRSWEAPPVSMVILMGVSGCGKTTVGRALSVALGWDFIDADDLHSPGNVAKMAAGVSLGDADRAPWLARVRAEAEARTARGARVVVACSALTEAYRAALAPDPASRRFVHLRGDFALIAGRLAGRSGHFMKEAMLRSQCDTLEEPLDALTIAIGQAPETIVGRIRDVLGLP